MSRRIAIVGAGPTGCLACLVLARAGHEVLLFEKRTRAACAESSSGASSVRSINLAIPRTTAQAMLALGADASLAENSVLLRGRIMHDRSGGLTETLYEDRDSDRPVSPLHPSEAPYSVGRGHLSRSLLAAVGRATGGSIFFGHLLTSADLGRGRLELATLEGKRHNVEVDVVIGADGAHSTIRALIAARAKEAAGADVAGTETRESTIRYRQFRLPAEGAAVPLSPRHFHLWPRDGYIVIALPNSDGSFTYTMFADQAASDALAALADSEAALELLERDLPDLMDGGRARRVTTTDPSGRAVAAETTHPLFTVKCRPWHFGRAVLVGDACHALLPFAGRGTAEGLADCITLARCLEAVPEAPETRGREASSALSAAFQAYERERRPEADALAGVTESLAPLLLAFLPESGLGAPL